MKTMFGLKKNHLKYIGAIGAVSGAVILAQYFGFIPQLIPGVPRMVLSRGRQKEVQKRSNLGVYNIRDTSQGTHDRIWKAAMF